MGRPRTDSGPTGRTARADYLAPMRPITLLLILAGQPALAWEFTPGLPCRLTHDTGAAQVELTFDPTQPLYTITIRRPAALPDAPVFSMRFEGAAGLTISTNRHVLSDGASALTVTDTGFGNVLDGLQFNRTATAVIGDEEITFPLDGATDPVAAFRACRVDPSV